MANQVKRDKKYSSDSFLEAFRDLGNDFVDTFKDDVVKKTGKDIIKTMTGGRPSPGSTSEESPNFADGLYKRETDLEKKYRKQARWQAEIARKEEKILFTRQDREVKLQVQALQEEIKNLAKATGDLAREAKIASLQTPPEVGKYHISFFEKLRNLIKSLKAQIQESSIWLAEWNRKSQKRNFYWRQAKKSGTQFTLSTDRQVSTQTG
jgi:hypothetical protein